MADILSSAISIAHLARVIWDVGKAAYKAGEEMEQFGFVMEDFVLQVDCLHDILKQVFASPEDHHYDGLRDIIRSSKQFDKFNGDEPDLDGGKTGVLQRLEKSMRQIYAELTIPSGVRGLSRRALWIKQKKKLDASLAEVKQFLELISSQLKYGDTLTNIDTNVVARNTSSRIERLEIEAIKAAEDRAQAAEDRRKTAVAREEKAAEKLRKAKEQLRLDIVRWISQLRFRERQSALVNLPQTKLMSPKLLDTEEFKLWTQGRPWILHCHGKPGSGKTLLCAFVGDHLKTTFESKGRNVPIVYMYLNHKERDSQTLGNLWASLLKQLLQTEGASFQSIEAQRLYQGPESESRPDWTQFYNAFCAEVVFYERVVIIVDALDEASPVDVAPQLLHKLHRLPKEHTSVFLTSQRTEDGRPAFLQIRCSRKAYKETLASEEIPACGKIPLKAYYRCHICNDGAFHLCEECMANNHYCENDSHQLVQPREVIMDIEPSKEEISRYVQAEFQKELEIGFDTDHNDDDDYQPSTFGTTPLGGLLHEKPWLKDEISDSIIAKADGMFALAQLYLSSFKSLALTEDEIEEMLDDPPEGYAGFYDQHMERISDGSLGPVASGFGMNAIAWVVAARRPLRLSELLHALAVNLKKKDPFKYSATRNKADIIRATAGLITIDEDEHAAVRLNHSTAQQYFDQSRERWFSNTPAHITQVSLYYLSMKELSVPRDSEWEDKYLDDKERVFPFLRYAYQYWGDHANAANADVDTHNAVMRFMTDEDKVAAAIQAMWFLKSEADGDWDVRNGANALHMCAWFGLTHAMTDLIDQGMDINSCDPKHALTPLMYACRRGKVAVVSLLLERSARVDNINNRGSSALFEAVLAGHSEVVRLLMTRPKVDVNAKHRMQSNQTVLMIAAREGRLGVVRYLLTHSAINIYQQDANGNTALLHAIDSRQGAAAMEILDHTKNPSDLDFTNWKGGSALILAASSGQNEIVERLLDKGANPSVQDKQGGGTALLRAVDGEHLETVQAMLRRPNVNIHCLDDEGRGLLHGAAVGGQVEILQHLLKSELDLNERDKKGRTPIHDACRQPKSEAAKLLLSAGADATLKDHAGRTPWTVAWQYGHLRTMKILDGRDPYDLTEQDINGEYPLASSLPVWALANLGNVDLVKAVIEFGKTKLDEADPDTDNTAIHYAISSDRLEPKQQLELVTILLNAGSPIDAKNISQRTPLHLAAMTGIVTILNLILSLLTKDDESTSVNQPDKFGTPPLLLANANRHMECCLLLIEAGATIPPTKALLKQSLFFMAIEFGKLEAVQRLVNMGADVQMKNVLGLAALQMAKEIGKSEVESFLRRTRTSRAAVDVTVEDKPRGERNYENGASVPSTEAAIPSSQNEQVRPPIASSTPSLEERFRGLNVPKHDRKSSRSRPRGGGEARDGEPRARELQLA